MEQARKVRGRERAEEWERAVAVVEAVVLQKDRVETASAQSAVRRCPINLKLPAMSRNVPDAGAL